MSGVLPALNRVAHDVVGAIGGPRILILIFHRVHRTPDPLFPNEMDAARFDALLEILGSSFRVMPLRAAVAAMSEGSLPSRVLAVTFDDGYADNAEVALPILRRHRLSATFFVSTAFLDGAGCMWNDRLIECVRRTTARELDLRDLELGLCSLSNVLDRQQLIGLLLGHAKYLPPAARDDFVKTIQKRAGVTGTFPELMMTSAQVRALHASGMHIGAHTMAHPILTSLGIPECRAEIQGGRERLEEIVEAPVDLFAYPNGKPLRDYDDRHVALVKELGFAAAVSTAPGAASSRDDMFQLPRYTPWGRSPAIWAARLLRNRLRSAAVVA